MNKEHGQREEAATSFVSLVLSQNFTKALKERGKIKKKKSKKREKQTNNNYCLKMSMFLFGYTKGGGRYYILHESRIFGRCLPSGKSEDSWHDRMSP